MKDPNTPVDIICEYLTRKKSIRLEQDSGVGAQVPEFGHFNASLKSEDTFDVDEGVATILKDPEREQFVIKTGEDAG